MSTLLLSSQTRLFESRITFIQQTIKQLGKKSIHFEHNLNSFSNKSQYLQNCISTLTIKVDQLTKTNNQSKRYGLNEITPTSTGYSNYFNNTKLSSFSKQNYTNNKQQSIASTLNIMQILESLQTMTLTNLQQLQKKFTLSHNDIESKCTNMQLKFMRVWKQAQTLIHTLTYQTESTQHKIKAVQQKLIRDKQFIQTNMQYFQQHVNQYINRSNGKFIDSVEVLHQQMAHKTKQIESKINKLQIGKQLQQIKQQLQDKLITIDTKLLKEIQKTNKTITQQQKTKPISQDQQKSTTLRIMQTKINQLQQQSYQIKNKIEDIQNQLKFNTKNEPNSKIQNVQKLKRQNQILVAKHNSQESYQPWSQSVNSLQNLGLPMIKKQLPPPKNLLQPSKNIMSNKFLPQKQSQYHKSQSSIDRIQSNKYIEQNQRYQQKNIEQQSGYVRGIAGLRSLKKKQEQRKGSLQRVKGHSGNKRFGDEQQLQRGNINNKNMRNPMTRHNQLKTIQSPSKLNNKKPLPPLIPSQKQFQRNKNNKNKGRSIKEYNYESEQNLQSQEQEGEESYFLDESGYLIDREGNRLVNQNGEEIQLSYEDLERLKEINQQQIQQE